jgi:hypothetical protein
MSLDTFRRPARTEPGPAPPAAELEAEAEPGVGRHWIENVVAFLATAVAVVIASSIAVVMYLA